MVVVPKGKEISIKKLLKETKLNDQYPKIKKLLIEQPEIIKYLTKCDHQYVPPFGSLLNMKTFIDESVSEFKVIEFSLG